MNKDKTSKLQELSLLFDTAWVTYKIHFLKLLKINTIPVLLVALLVSAFPFIASFQSLIDYIDSATIINILTLVFGVTVLVAVVSSLNYIAQIKFLAEGSADADVSILPIYQHASKILFPYIWVVVLTIVSVLAGTVLLVVPGVVVAIWLSFSAIVLVVGDVRGGEALKLSKKYVRGIWTAVFLRLLAAGFLGLLVSAAFTILISFIRSVIIENTAVDHVLNLAYQLVIAPYFVVYGYELYKDVVRANELVIEDSDADGPDGNTKIVGVGEVLS